MATPTLSSETSKHSSNKTIKLSYRPTNLFNPIINIEFQPKLLDMSSVGQIASGKLPFSSIPSTRLSMTFLKYKKYPFVNFAILNHVLSRLIKTTQPSIAIYAIKKQKLVQIVTIIKHFLLDIGFNKTFITNKKMFAKILNIVARKCAIDKYVFLFKNHNKIMNQEFTEALLAPYVRYQIKVC